MKKSRAECGFALIKTLRGVVHFFARVCVCIDRKNVTSVSVVAHIQEFLCDDDNDTRLFDVLITTNRTRKILGATGGYLVDLHVLCFCE